MDVLSNIDFEWFDLLFLTGLLSILFITIVFKKNNSPYTHNIHTVKKQDELDKKRYKAFIDMIPYKQHYKNVRSRLSTKQWTYICAEISKKHNYKCVVCGQTGFQQLCIEKDENFGHPVECHEVWEFSGNTQKLVDIVPLCPYCHKARHIALAKKHHYLEQVYEHMAKVNGTSVDEMMAYHSNAMKAIQTKTQSYKIDLTYLNGKYSLDIQFTKNETEFNNK